MLIDFLSPTLQLSRCFIINHPLRKIAARKKLVFSYIHKKDEMNITFILINIIVICFNRKIIFYLCMFMPLHI
jgi:hypothetical protein